MEDRKLVTKFLVDKHIDIVLSSPYKRTVDTVKDFADSYGIKIDIIYDFRERKVESGWIEDFIYKLSDGEFLQDVQMRNISALQQGLNKYSGKNIVVGSHGTALSTIINYYYHSFGYNDFEKIKNVMPWIVEFVFDENAKCIMIKKHDLCGLWKKERDSKSNSRCVTRNERILFIRSPNTIMYYKNCFM